MANDEPRPMKADLHVHAALSSSIGFDAVLFAELLGQARARGVEALGLVSHLFMPDLSGLFDRLGRRYAYGADHYDADGIALYPGIEVDTAEGPHLVALGSREAILTFYARYAADVAQHRPAPAAAFFARQEGLALLRICAHPLRPGRELARLPVALGACFDALELNASDLRRVGPDLLQETRALAAAHGLPVVAGSDAHHALQVGAVQTRFAQPFVSLDELKEQVRAGALTLWAHPELETMVGAAQEAKKCILAERVSDQAHQPPSPQ